MKVRAVALNTALVTVSVLLVSLVFDRALALLGFPSEQPPRVAHPAGYTERVENIEFAYTFSTNSRGLRNPEIPLRKDNGEYRILMAGDSFVQGIGVEMDETIPAYLTGALSTQDRRVQVLNGGLSGTAPVGYGKLIFYLLDIYDLDAVLVTLYANDVGTTWEKAEPTAIYPVNPQRWGLDRLVHALWPRTYILVEQALDAGNTSEEEEAANDDPQSDMVSRLAVKAAKLGIDPDEIHAWEQRVRIWMDTLTPEQRELAQQGKFNWNGVTYGLSKPGYWAQGVDIDTPVAQRKWTVMAGVLEEIVRGVRARGKEVAIVYIPSKWQYDPRSHDAVNPTKLAGPIVRESWLSGEQEIARRLRVLARDAQVPILDLTSDLRREVAAGADLNWRHDSHFNSAGNRFAARVISTWLLNGPVFQTLK